MISSYLFVNSEARDQISVNIKLSSSLQEDFYLHIWRSYVFISRLKGIGAREGSSSRR